MGTYVHYAGSVRRRVFASFPLFYSTSFGGAYWLWILILFTFVAQAVSYQYRRKRGNLYGTRFFDILLVISGALSAFCSE